MEDKKMQIKFAPDIRALEKMGADWYNIVMDISDYLESRGFHYIRSLGFVNDRELSEDELASLAKEIVDIALGEENVLYLNAAVISNIKSFTFGGEEDA